MTNSELMKFAFIFIAPGLLIAGVWYARFGDLAFSKQGVGLILSMAIFIGGVIYSLAIDWVHSNGDNND